MSEFTSFTISEISALATSSNCESWSSSLSVASVCFSVTPSVFVCTRDVSIPSVEIYSAMNPSPVSRRRREVFPAPGSPRISNLQRGTSLSFPDTSRSALR